MILTRRWWKLQRWLTCINADDGDDTEGSKNCGKNVEDDDNNEGNEEDDTTDKDVEDDDLGDDADTAGPTSSCTRLKLMAIMAMPKRR